MRTYYITPDGGGDGTAWTSPARLDEIPYLLPRLPAGGEILVAADRGEYALTAEVPIEAGGTMAAPIAIRGVETHTLAPLAALIRGNRGPDEVGCEGFRLKQGAGNLRFANFDFRDIGNGCFRVGAPVTNLVVEDCRYDNVYRFLENTVTGAAQDASLKHFSIARCTGVRTARSFSRLRYDSSDGVFDSCIARGVPIHGGDELPEGCAIEDTAHDIIYRRCTMEGFQQWNVEHYWNGDGFSDESDNANIRYEGCEARGSTDGGFDCKSRNVVLDSCIAEDNKRNFRVWSRRAQLINCVSRMPRFRGRGRESASPSHVWIGGDGPSVVELTNLTIYALDGTDIFEFENDAARAEVHGCTVHAPIVNWGEVGVRRGARGAMTVVPPH